jgi:hypothetical protein
LWHFFNLSELVLLSAQNGENMPTLHSCYEMSSCEGKCQAHWLVHGRHSINTGSPLLYQFILLQFKRKVIVILFSLCFSFFQYFLQGLWHCNQIKERQCKRPWWALCLGPLSHDREQGCQCCTLKALSTARGSSFVSRCTSEGQAWWAKGRSWFLWDCRTTTHKPSTSKTWKKKTEFQQMAQIWNQTPGIKSWF